MRLPLPWIQRLTHLIAPPVCTLCGGTGQALDEPWGLDLCHHCEAACPRAAPEPEFAGAFCLYRYEDPVDQMIVRLKFRHELAQARVLGILFARAWRSTGRPLPDCILPMPLHISRLRERGFCQTTLLARHIARRLRARGVPLPLCTGLLRRTRATRAQSGLPAAERARNLQDAFACDGTAPRPRRVALFDDVLTTGNTALAAAAALRAGGVEHVELWAVARASLRHDTAGPPARVATPIC